MKAAKDAGVTVVSLPMVNQWTQVSQAQKPSQMAELHCKAQLPMLKKPFRLEALAKPL